MASTEEFKTYQSVMRELFNLLQDEVFQAVDLRVAAWIDDNAGENGVVNHDAMKKEVAEKMDDLVFDLDWNVLNGILRVIGMFRLNRSFNYRNVGKDVLAVRQLQLLKSQLQLLKRMTNKTTAERKNK